MKCHSRSCQTHSWAHSSTRCRRSQGDKEKLLPWLAENTRGKYCSVPAHQKQRARVKTVLDCRANKRAFFGPVEIGKADLESARTVSVLGCTGNQIQEHQSKLTEEFPNYFLFSIERIKQSLKRLLQLRDASCFRNTGKILVLNIFKLHIHAKTCLSIGQEVGSPPRKNYHRWLWFPRIANSGKRTKVDVREIFPLTEVAGQPLNQLNVLHWVIPFIPQRG